MAKKNYQKPKISDIDGRECTGDYRRTYGACNHCTAYIEVADHNEITKYLKAQE